MQGKHVMIYLLTAIG